MEDTLNFNHYFTNDELLDLLDEWVSTYPNLIQKNLSVIVMEATYWLLTLTNQTTGTI
jgi:hypothetical protein